MNGRLMGNNGKWMENEWKAHGKWIENEWEIMENEWEMHGK